MWMGAIPLRKLNGSLFSINPENVNLVLKEKVQTYVPEGKKRIKFQYNNVLVRCKRCFPLK